MTKQHIFTYQHFEEDPDTEEETEYTIHFKYYPGRPATMETPFEPSKVEVMKITFVLNSQTVEVTDRDDFEFIASRLDKPEMMGKADQEIEDAWEERERNKPDDTPSLPDPWWKDK